MPATDEQIGVIRFHIGDDVQDLPAYPHNFSDAQIQTAFAAADDHLGDAVCLLIERQIAEVSRVPDVSDSGLEFRPSTTMSALRLLLSVKRLEIGSIGSVAVNE